MKIRTWAVLALITMGAGCADPPVHMNTYVIEDDCEHGEMVHYQVQQEPVWWKAYVRYEAGIWEEMVATPIFRTDNAPNDETPVYRDADTVSFMCGYKWEGLLPDPILINGIDVGTVEGYRLVYILAEQADSLEIGL